MAVASARKSTDLPGHPEQLRSVRLIPGIPCNREENHQYDIDTMLHCGHLQQTALGMEAGVLIVFICLFLVANYA